MRCAVYVRVSTDMETQKTSIAHQKNFFEKYIENKRWTLYKIYQDIESGRSIKKREGLQALLEDSKEGKFDIVLTKSISRFARNTLEGLILVRDFKARNIRFVTIEDGFDSEEYDEFMFTLLLSIAQKESEKMSERIRFGKLCRAKRGYYNGSNPPYGYKKLDKYTMIPAEDITTYVVKKIFSMYLEGKGLYKIAKELNKHGYPTPSQAAGKQNSGVIWHQSSIRKILSNRFYVGDLVQNKSRTVNVLTGERKENKEEIIIIKNTHDGIIDPLIFEEVQKRLKENKKKKIGNQTHLFSGILVCGECNRKMYYKKNRDAYICATVNKMGKDYCNGAYIKEEILIKLICSELKKIINENCCKNMLLKEIEKEIKNGDEQKKLRKLEKSIIKLNQKKDRLIDMMMDYLIDKKMYIKKMREIEGQKSLLEENKEVIIERLKKRKGYGEQVVKEIFMMESLDRMVINKLIEKIKVFKNGKVIIEYTFKL
ncbi:recombinase family protein [Crassaminicella thermophila]|uniref:Recombinase family protein n=1 Tax=Crassaminicella thermophila TaxID=2599308 RepID=A0A5C0SJ80_CRATE|nr:recombinase family protein [Crassaminicella thermophila]QEK13288.1 recombinase family protein [Crassaminicella thermophila]